MNQNINPWSARKEHKTPLDIHGKIV